MPEVIQIGLTLLCAAAVGLLLKKANMPGGMMVGAVIGACLLGVSTGQACMPAAGKTIAQIIAGAFIGAGIKRQDIYEMRLIAKPALILFPCLLLTNIITGILIWKTGAMDLTTAMMSATPGGLSDIPMIAADMGADPSMVLVLQFVRMVMGIGAFPLMIRIATADGDAGTVAVQPVAAKRQADGKAAALTLAVATVCGLIGKASPVPSGTMAFATLGSIIFSCVYAKAQTPARLRQLAQLLSGAYVGASITMEQIHAMGRLGLPIVILIGMYSLGCFAIGWLLMKTGCFSRREGMLAATPAGASDMALISADLGIQDPKLIVLQVTRLIVVVLLFPSILSVVIGLIQ